jgi:NADH:ubiquinone oxidoreductase subunit E
MPASLKHDRRIHPGSGRRRGPDHPKGRQVDPAALGEVQGLLGERERRRDLLIEHLHLLQDHFGCLHARHLAALAEEMRLALVEVYEVASFYAHFDIVMDGEAPPPPMTVRVCDSLSCELAGAALLLENLRGRLGDGVRVVRAPCMGGCPRRGNRARAARARYRGQRRRRGFGGRAAPGNPGICRLRRLPC